MLLLHYWFWFLIIFLKSLVRLNIACGLFGEFACWWLYIVDCRYSSSFSVMSLKGLCLKIKKILYHTPCDGQTLRYTTRSHTVSYPVAYRYWISHYHTHTTDRRYGTLPGPIPYSIIQYPVAYWIIFIISLWWTDATVHYPVPYRTVHHTPSHIEYHIIPTRRTDATVHYLVPYRRYHTPSHIE